ncbi:MAG TPA: alkaline phosphatase family protein [Solirubrobacteraceae bacterium]|nr:alkaline phosphatase family protein [Solirubrobacteraceae bacterium]
MRRRARMGMLLWPVLLIALVGWLVSGSNSSARPAAALATTAAAPAAGPTPQASVAGAQSRCPIRHRRSQPCCPPPTGAGKPPSSRCLSLGSSPNPSTDGQTVTIAGRLFGPRHAHAVVLLWRRLPGERRFHPTAVTRTGRLGDYSLTVALNGNRWWYVTARRFRSRTVHQRVASLITLASSETRAAPNDLLTFSGSVSPSHAGEQLTLQELEPGGWQAVAQGSLDGASTFSLGYALTTDGTYELRAYLQGAKHNIDSYSPAVIVTVNPIFKIKHIVVIMQENRSFDQYFGTYPGADGIPGVAGNPGTVPCVPDPVNGGCVKPFHDTSDKNYGGPHGAANATADMDCTNMAARAGCKMDGFVGQAEHGSSCTSDDPNCSPCTTGSQSQCIDVMGYHDGSDIPNYWDYAENYVLQDHMYEPNASWSLPSHLYMVSEWSAYCTNPNNAYSCTNALENPNTPSGDVYAWTDITWLLHAEDVSWAYYVFQGTEPDCDDNSAMTCAPVQQGPKTPSIWNPLPSFTDVAQDGQLANIQTLSNFFTAARDGTLPAVSWIDPNGTVSEHPPALVSAGQTYVTGLVNAIMQSPDWDSTAIFLAWDDWGGFYDQVVPPAADANGFGLRVPGIVISPYAKQGYIDHQTLSFDAYTKFIEDEFLGDQRLDPATDGRPDPRPDVREDNPILGDLTSDFDFNRPPRAPMILPVCPATDLTPAPKC